MVVVNVEPDHTPKLALVDRNYMIQAVSSQAGNPSFGESALPWRSKRSANLFESKPIDPSTELHPVDLVIVANQKTTRQIECAGLDYLLSCPRCRRMLGHVEVEDSSPLKAQYKEHIDDAKGLGRHHGKINREGLVQMIAYERRPSLPRTRRWKPFRMWRETVISEITIPSLSSSPWIRGAPHSTFISAISEISLRTSTEIRGRPAPRFLLFHRQKSLKP